MKILPFFSLKNETTFGCGGKARWFCRVQNIQEFISLLSLHKDKKLYILGGGSKSLCPDSGFDGLVISTKNLNHISFSNGLIVCESGVMLDKLLDFCLANNLSGLEWAAGIPASLGGMAVMNAGAFSHEIGEFIEKIEIYDGKKTILMQKQDITFSYRDSSLKGKSIIRIYLKLTKSTKEEISEKITYYKSKKSTNQPIEKLSAGSIFKREKNVIPAKIIDKLGLKGATIGGAKVSDKHCGFIVNTGTATATDVITLIEQVRSKVETETGVILKNELIIME